MLCVIQYPIVDLRAFYASAPKLSRPSWPFPQADKEYVRAFGPIRARPRGGINSWLGEAHICESKNLFSFVGPKFLTQDTYKKFKKKVAFKRFFSDGQVIAKLEVGVVVKRPPWPGPFFHASTLIFNLLKTEVVCAGENSREATSLSAFSSALRKAYAKSTSPSGKSMSAQEYIRTGNLQIVLECYDKEMNMPSKARHFAIKNATEKETKVFFWRENVSGFSFNVWALVSKEGAPLDKALREFRLYILRLYVEQYCLSEVMRAIADRRISAPPHSTESDHLQRYVSSAIKRITKAGRSAEEIINSGIWDMAIDANDNALPGARSALLEQVELWRPRPSVRTAINNYTLLNMGTIMNDKYENNGQANSMGPNATISDTKMQQNINSNASSALLGELRSVVDELHKKASDSDQKIDIDMIEKAIPLLEKNEKDEAGGYLKRCSKWVLETAEDIGAKIASETLKSYISG